MVYSYAVEVVDGENRIRLNGFIERSEPFESIDDFSKAQTRISNDIIPKLKKEYGVIAQSENIIFTSFNPL